jgi:hypothetical protein
MQDWDPGPSGVALRQPHHDRETDYRLGRDWCTTMSTSAMSVMRAMSSAMNSDGTNDLLGGPSGKTGYCHRKPPATYDSGLIGLLARFRWRPILPTL